MEPPGLAISSDPGGKFKNFPTQDISISIFQKSQDLQQCKHSILFC